MAGGGVVLSVLVLVSLAAVGCALLVMVNVLFVDSCLCMVGGRESASGVLGVVHLYENSSVAVRNHLDLNWSSNEDSILRFGVLDMPDIAIDSTWL